MSIATTEKITEFLKGKKQTPAEARKAGERIPATSGASGKRPGIKEWKPGEPMPTFIEVGEKLIPPSKPPAQPPTQIRPLTKEQAAELLRRKQQR